MRCLRGKLQCMSNHIWWHQIFALPLAKRFGHRFSQAGGADVRRYHLGTERQCSGKGTLMRQTALQASEAASVLQSSLSLTASGASREGALSRQSSEAVLGLQLSQGSHQTSQASLIVLALAPTCCGNHHSWSRAGQVLAYSTPCLWSLYVPPPAGQCSCMQSYTSLSICCPLPCSCSAEVHTPPHQAARGAARRAAHPLP